MIVAARRSNLSRIIVFPFLLGLAACSPPYEPPVLPPGSLNYAAVVIAEEKKAASALKRSGFRESTARRMFANAQRRVLPAARRTCSRQRPDAPETECDFVVRILEDKRYAPNAFLIYDEQDRPLIGFTQRFVLEARNEDEMAYALAHEVGHHLADHRAERQQQAEIGLILGILLGAAAATAPTPNPSAIQYPGNMSYALREVYSQSQELEADDIGTRITLAAGYDPNLGARIFAREEKPTSADGQLNLWGSHPPGLRRIALVHSLTNTR